MQANSIEEVIQLLDQIIANATTTPSPMGYFAALYRKVTRRVKLGIEKNEFEDGARMERLDVLFANRYLTAYHQYQQQERPTESWQIAFAQTQRYWPIVLQHLLWGINAHINLDLGIAAEETAKERGEPLTALKSDFDQINTLLASLVSEVEEELSKIWPTLRWILTLSKNIDDFLINFSMERARDGAWKFANELYRVPTTKRAAMIADRDQKVAQSATLINPPGIIPELVFLCIRIGERGTTPEKIKVLE